MFLIDVELKPSLIPDSGLGVFIRHALPRGSVVWVLHPSFDRFVASTVWLSTFLHLIRGRPFLTHAQYI